MKTIYFSLIIILFQAVFTANIYSQVETPQLSPVCEFKQTVGLTEITFSYSRPSKRDRIVFGNVVPYDKMWRFGANKNSTITISEEIYFGQETLPKGTYAMFVMPGKESWELNFYNDFSRIEIVFHSGMSFGYIFECKSGVYYCTKLFFEVFRDWSMCC